MRNVAANTADENSHGPVRLARAAVRGEDRGMNRSIVAALMVLTTACVPHSAYKPSARPAKSEPAAAFAVAIRELTDRGASIETKDEAAGLIVTKWEEEERGETIYRYRWRVLINAERVRVESQCSARVKNPSYFMSGEPHDCSETQPDARQAESDRLANVIADAVEK